MYQITFSCPTLSTFVELAQLIAAKGLTDLGIEKPVEKVGTKSKKQESKQIEEVQVKETTPEEAPALHRFIVVETKKVEQVKKETAYEDVSKKTLELVRVKGKDTAINVLSSFGASKAPDLKKEQYEEYVNKVEQLLGA